MKTFTFSTLGLEREKKIMELIHSHKAACFTHAATIVLTEEFGVQYGCFGGTPVMPICEFKPIQVK